jgi:hypothetical protein
VANLKENLSRGLPFCSQLPEREGALAIVASAPSVSKHIEKFYDWPGEVWAINGAYDYLLTQGVLPDGFFAIDPLPGLVEYVQNPQPETTFYIASTCDPSVLDALAGYNVRLFHGADENSDKFPKDQKVIFGGTTAVTRAPFLALLLGWRDITMFGIDSSYSETSPYCYRWKTYQEDINEPILKVMINGEGPFYTEIGLLKQVSALNIMLKMFNRKQEMLKFEADGLLDAFLRSPDLDESQFEVVKDDAA